MDQQLRSSTYPRARLLVETAWLAEHLDDPNIRIIDCDASIPTLRAVRSIDDQSVAQAMIDAYRHDPNVEIGEDGTLTQRAPRHYIPGAVGLPVDPYIKAPETGQPGGAADVASAEEVQELLRGLGVNQDTHVILYDSNASVYAGRVWWVFWYYGLESVSLLNGGWAAWTAEGRPTVTAPKEVARGNVVAREHPERIATAETIVRAMRDDDFAPLDTRLAGEWAGTGDTRYTNVREGHIPRAVHIDWFAFVDFSNATRFKSAADISRMLDEVGLSPEKWIVPYCQHNVRGAHAVYVLSLMGYDRLACYELSWAEWGNREDLPLGRP